MATIDEEAATATATDRAAAKARRKRNMKYWILLIIAVVVLQTIVIEVFTRTVMSVKTPKVRFSSVTIESLNATKSSFNMRIIAQVTVKNRNFGPFKFENSTATVTYNGATVGQAIIIKGRAKARQTKKIDITVDVSSDRRSGASGTLALSCHAKLSGKVHLFKIIKKNKSAEMSCTMTVNVANKEIQNWNCE